jgi:hypothetical protein
MKEIRSPHGSHRRYAVHKCHCDVCREGNTRRMNEARARAADEGAAWLKNMLQANRERHVTREYGITPEQHAELEARHGPGCWLCGRVPERRRAIDHDHTTGRVRGLLCTRCNTVLGWLETVGVEPVLRWLDDSAGHAHQRP